MRDPHVELLAPAGSPDALLAAVEGGADAVYFGGNLFSCRMRAKNFTESELRDALTLCRDTGVRSYLTLNARLRDGELRDALDMAAKLWQWGADGLILSDLGFAEAVHRAIPEFDLHASTQLSCLSVSDAEALRARGIRVQALSHYDHENRGMDTHCLVVNYAALNEEVFAAVLASLPQEIDD